jgi:hypothetical protein
MNEHENAPRFRSGNVVHIGRGTITNAETTELRRLFDQVADTCDVASQVLGKSGPPPMGPELDRLRELSARADAMVERLKSILD